MKIALLGYGKMGKSGENALTWSRNSFRKSAERI
jgi:hypothetical protein